MSQLSFSIVIPHHNIPRLLERCLASIPQRNDLEIIIVDDNSDPSIVDFANFPGQDRPDTKIIFNKENKGGGAARNIGMKQACGKWMMFADADDFFHDCIRDAFEQYKETDADMVFFNADCVNTDTLVLADKNRAAHLNKFIKQYIVQPKIGEDKLRFLFGEPWSRMIKKSLIESNKIQFEETKIHNDTQFAYLVGYYAKSIKVDPSILYCITERVGSTSTQQDEFKILTRISVFAKAEAFFEQYNILTRPDFLYKQLSDLYLSNSHLYKKGMKIALDAGLNKRDVNKGLLKALPKAVGRKYIKKNSVY